MQATHEENRDNYWVDVANLRIVAFRKVQGAL